MRLTRQMAAGTMALLAALAPLHAEPETAPAATNAAELSPAYVNNVRELLEALRTYEWLAAAPAYSATQTAADREFDMAFRRQVTPDETYRRMVPVYARFITPKQAAELAKVARTPAFRKREARGQSVGGAPIYLSTFLTPAEMAELRRIDAMPAVIALRATQKKITADVNETLGRWARQFDERLSDKAEEVLNKVSADLAAAREAGEGRTITIGRVSVPYMDKVVWISGSAMIKMSNAHRKFANELKYVGFDDIVKPEYLGSKVSLAHSRTVVEQVEASLEKLLKDIDQAIKERDEALRGVESPRMSNYLKQVEEGTGGSYAYMVEFGEGYRRMLDEHRRVLAFIGERQSKVHYQDGKLLFADDADLAMARDIFARLDLASADLRALVTRQAEKEEAAQHRRHAGEAGR